MTIQTIARVKYFRFFIFLSCLALNVTHASSWRHLGDGIQYRRLDSVSLTPWSHVHVFRIDPSKNHFGLLMAKDFGKLHASVAEFLEHTSANIAVNGGFFGERYEPLGLRIQDGVKRNSLKPISWWGIFYIKDGKAHISNIKHFSGNAGVDLAIQTGPRLLIHGRIPSLKPGRAERSALGITRKGKVILLVTENTPLSTRELAELMRAEPIGALYALNLDGGSSTQLAAHIHGFSLRVHGFSEVADVLTVTLSS